MADFSGASNFTTGPATIPDVGILSYNGCLFSPLFETNVSGNVIKDNAQRTVKYMEYTITADGYVTLPVGALSIGPTMATLRTLLTAQAGTLVYQGRGCDIIVNQAIAERGFGTVVVAGRDVAWGPIPELFEFQPLGAGRSAKVKWSVKVRIPEVPPKNVTTGGIAVPMLQFNYETSVSYGEDGFSALSCKGTMEIPITRSIQTSRTLALTVDNLRFQLDRRVFAGIDLERFRITRREFNVSRDKRTMEFNVQAEEKPYMDLPPYCTLARGTYTVRPAKAGMGLCLWLCTLRATYTVRANRPRRFAWFAFLALLRERMAQSALCNIDGINANQNPATRGNIPNISVSEAVKLAFTQGWKSGFSQEAGFAAGQAWSKALQSQNQQVAQGRTAWLMDFSIDEGLYQDSKTTSFSATWRLATRFSHILLASGLWTKLPEKNSQNDNVWKITMSDIMGSSSWLINVLDPTLDIIVDFGSN